jgi:predicted nucleic acid-binding Zn ribbon protein
MSPEGRSEPYRPRPRRRRRAPKGVPGEFAEPVALGDALARVGAELGLDDPVVAVALTEHWADVVGEGIAAHSRPRTLRGGVLTIAVDASPWATELRYLEQAIRDRVIAVTGVDVVNTIRVVVEPPDDAPANP